MCFWKKKLTPMVPTQRRLLTFGKNKYGSGNDLSGCGHDSENISKKLKSLFPDFDVRKFIDYDVTADRYKEEVSKAIATLRVGSTVLVLADSCFSGDVTKLFNPNFSKHPPKIRFYDSGLPMRTNVKTKIFQGKKETIRWIVISACGEHQTASDAYIGGSYVGAFTYFALFTLKKGMTYREWFFKIKEYLPSAEYEQSPTLDGPDYLLDRKVFEDETLVIHNSSHGSYTSDINGDEKDGKDEGLYFDRLLLDDEIHVILDKIPL